jgi:serine-type D-Ala-D-Ala carboxypeptidase/endopeptidase
MNQWLSTTPKPSLVRNSVLAVFALAFFVPAVVAEDIVPALQSFLDEFTTIKNEGAGIVVGMVDEHGSRVFSYGKMASDGPAVNGDTLFEIGSITKTFTTLLLQDMIARGEMQLEDPVTKFLPSTVSVPSYQGKQLLVAHLATQTSALPFNPDNLKQTNVPGGNIFENYTAEKLYESLSRQTFHREPGTEWGYSNFGMGLLGHAIELKANDDYGLLVVNRICRPLGMLSTGVELSPELKSRLATGHDAGRQTPQWELGVMAGTGGIRSTVNDLLKYVSAQIGLIESPLTQLMQKTHEVRRKNLIGWGDTAMPWFNLGVYQPPGTQLLGHSGGTGGYSNFIGFDKQRRRGVVVLSNQTTFSSSTIGWLLLQSPWHANERLAAVELSDVAFDSCVGQYQSKGLPILNIRREGNRLIMSGQFVGELLPGSDTMFFSRIGTKPMVKIIRNESGRLTGLELTRYGTRYEETKILIEPGATAEQGQTAATKPEKPDPSLFDEYVGNYQFGPNDVFEIRRTGNKLVGHRAGQADFGLEPQSATDFGVPLGAQISFVRNQQGKVNNAIVRPFLGEDREAKRVAPSPG